MPCHAFQVGVASFAILNPDFTWRSFHWMWWINYYPWNQAWSFLFRVVHVQQLTWWRWWVKTEQRICTDSSKWQVPTLEWPRQKRVPNVGLAIHLFLVMNCLSLMLSTISHPSYHAKMFIALLLSRISALPWASARKDMHLDNVGISSKVDLIWNCWNNRDGISASWHWGPRVGVGLRNPNYLTKHAEILILLGELLGNLFNNSTLSRSFCWMLSETERVSTSVWHHSSRVIVQW